jgi:L-seryl-tRNA(Ser) seleniumtransferase
MSERLRDLPSVEQLLQTPKAAALISSYGRPITVQAIRDVLQEYRDALRNPQMAVLFNETEIFSQTEARLETWLHPSLTPVINATGVVLHTNLGRAPLSHKAIQAVQRIALGYSNLEFDLDRGARGSRMVHAEAYLCQLTGAEAALVVNNNAAALLLALSALARRKRVVIPRSQMVEVGGGFRIPDVMKQSGAQLVEVGTTNRTHLTDYEEALQEPAALVMNVHQSNFKIVGFTTEPMLSDLAQTAHRQQVPVMVDLGSGVLLDTARFGLPHEPTVQETIAAGADLVCFSGDKLLGGPQAGILVGQKRFIEKIRRHPLARAVRADKLCLAALAATLQHYLQDEAVREIPIWQMIAASLEDLQARALRWREALGFGEVVCSQSTIGGGSLPEETLPTFVLSLPVSRPNQVLARLRLMNPPVIARVEADHVVLDPRTVIPEEEPELLAGLKQLFAQPAA